MGQKKKKNQTIYYVYMHNVCYELRIMQLRRIHKCSPIGRCVMCALSCMIHSLEMIWRCPVTALCALCINYYKDIGNGHLLIEKPCLIGKTFPDIKNTTKLWFGRLGVTGKIPEVRIHQTVILNSCISLHICNCLRLVIMDS